MSTETTSKQGQIQQIVGVVLDVEFPESLPAIYNALEVEKSDGTKLVLEVSQHLSAQVVRAAALGSTDGLARGQAVKDNGSPISVPVGKEALGRLFNVTGNPIDGKGGTFSKREAIHKPAPTFKDQSTKTEIFETGI